MSEKLKRFEYLATMQFDNTVEELNDLRNYFAALEAQNKKLVEALETGMDIALSAVSHVAAANYPHREAEAVQSIEKYFERVLSEVTK